MRDMSYFEISMRIMPGTNAMENIRIESTNMNMNSKNGWVTPEPSDISSKIKNKTGDTENAEGDVNGYGEQSSKSPRKQHVIPVVQVASNILFIDSKSENDLDFHKHNRGRALSTPEISQQRHESFLHITNGIIESDSPSPRKRTSLSEESHKEKHKSRRGSRTLSQSLISSKSSPNFQDLLKPSNHSVDRLISVEEQDNDNMLLLSGQRYSNLPPMLESKRNQLRKSKSSLNLNTQPLSRTSTPGEMRRSTVLFDLEQVSPSGSRANTPRHNTSRHNARNRTLEPILHSPSLVNGNIEEISDEISPPLYSSGVPVSIGHPSTPQLTPLRHRTSTPQIIIQDEGVMQLMPKRRHSLDPIPSPSKRPLSRNVSKPDLNNIISENMIGENPNAQDDESNIFGPAKADVLLNLRYSPSTQSPMPSYTFCSKLQNEYVNHLEKEQLKTSMSVKKRRPGTGLITPALRAETATNKHRNQNSHMSTHEVADSGASNNTQNNNEKPLTKDVTLSQVHRSLHLNDDNKNITESSTNAIEDKPQKINPSTDNKNGKVNFIDTKQTISFVSLEELEAASPIFAESTTGREKPQKANTPDVQVMANNISKNKDMKDEYLLNMDEGTFSLQVSENKSRVDKQMNGVIERPASVKLVVSEQDSAVSITLSPPEESNKSKAELIHKQNNLGMKKGPISSRAAEATSRLYESSKKVTSRVSNATSKNQIRPGRTKSKSQLLSNERDRSLSSDKSKTPQKSKGKKSVTTMGSRPSNLKPKKGKVIGTDKAKYKPPSSQNLKKKSVEDRNEERIARGLAYEIKTKETLRRMEERLNSPAVKAKHLNKEINSARTKPPSTPVIEDAYPKFDKDEENLLQKVKVTVHDLPYPRRVQSAVTRKTKPQSAGKKRKDSKTSIGDDEVSTAVVQNKDKVVRATSAGLVVERGSRQSRKSRKNKKDKNILENDIENALPPNFDPSKHAIVSGHDWHVIAEKSTEVVHNTEKDNNKLLLEDQSRGDSGLLSCDIMDKLKLDTNFEFTDEKYSAPLSPIQEVQSSAQSSLRTNSSSHISRNGSPLISHKSLQEIADPNLKSSEYSNEEQLKDTSLINPTDSADVNVEYMKVNIDKDISTMLGVGDSNSVAPYPNKKIVRNCSSPNENGIEEILLPDDRTIKNSLPMQDKCFEDLKTENLLDDPQLIATKNIDGNDVIIMDKKFTFPSSHTGEKPNQSVSDLDDVFQHFEELSNTDVQQYEPGRQPSDDESSKGDKYQDVDDSDEEEDDELDVAAQLQKIMRSMRERSELDAHTLRNYRKSNEDDDSDANSDTLSHHGKDTATLTEKASESEYWKEYYETPPLEVGVLSLLFDERESELKSNSSKRQSNQPLLLKKVSFPDPNAELFGNSEGFRPQSSISNNCEQNFNLQQNTDVSENLSFVPLERFPSCVTNSSENTLVDGNLSIPFESNDGKHDINGNEIFQSVEDFDDDSDEEDIILELQKTLQAPSDSENTVEDNENRFDDEQDSRQNSGDLFNGPKLTQETLKRHNKEQEKVLEKEGENQSSSIYKIQQYKVSDRNNMQSRASAFTRTTDYSQNTDSTMKAELDTAACLGWRKGKELGHGSYGTVFEGLTRDGQLIAVKQVELTVNDRRTAEKEYKLIHTEVDLLRMLRHENIVRLLGTSLEGNMVQIFMEHITGGSISSLLQQYGPLKERQFRSYTKQILSGVEFLHESSVVHRDIKGSNVMLMTSGTIKLIDFGCAKRLRENSLKRDSESSDDGRLLKSLRGTPYWMAPEVITSEGHGPKSDIWSIGCTVYEMAMKHPPLRDMEPYQAMYYIGEGNKMPELQRPQFSRSAIDFVKKCLVRKPEGRPSATELLNHRFILHKKKRKSEEKNEVT